MTPFILAKRKGIHIINLTRTASFSSEACDLVFDAISRGRQFIIVATEEKVNSRFRVYHKSSMSLWSNKKWLGAKTRLC
jgi:small subunit ribosomal protein S2